MQSRSFVDKVDRLCQSRQAMGLSYRLGSPLRIDDRRRHVLVTGAAGRIGAGFAAHASTRFQLRLMDRPGIDTSRIEPYGEIVHCNLDDLARLETICEGVDTVVHLAADPRPSAPWASLLKTNIVGAYNLFVAAKAAGCRRVVFASSVHTVSGHGFSRQVTTADPVNPNDLYGVSKCFGEALGRYMAEKGGLSVIAVRIGAFGSPEVASDPSSARLPDIFVAPQDLYQLLLLCIQVEGLRFAVFHGISDNRCKALDISDARELLGYAPTGGSCWGDD